MLHSMRRRIQAIAAAEAAGQPVWTEAFDERVRSRVRHVWSRIANGAGWDEVGRCFETARRLILEQEGIASLTAAETWASADFDQFFSTCPDDMWPTALEALTLAIEARDQEGAQVGYIYYGYANAFTEEVNEIFHQERVAWKFVDHQMVEMKSSELHEAVLEPALRLLHDPRFAAADQSYRKALEELSRGDGADAITDAGTALQEVLTTVGCEENQLGDLIKSAKAKGLLASHDTPVSTAIEKALRWVAADRSQSGESHHASSASREDAWLIVHIVGAFIVRLAEGTARPTP